MKYYNLPSFAFYRDAGFFRLASLSRCIFHRSGSTTLSPSEASPALLSGFLHPRLAVYAMCQVALVVCRKATRQGSSR